MTELKENLAETLAPVGTEFTQSLERLRVPNTTADDILEVGGVAFLFSNNSDATKWAPRWLNHNDIKTTVLTSPEDALQKVRNSPPAAIIVDALMMAGSGMPLYQVLLNAQDLEMPVFVMCSNAKEATAALEHDPYDVIRKPFEWSLVSRRVKYAISTRNLLDHYEDGQESLREALEIADTARERLRSRESFEPITGLPNKKKFAEIVKRSMNAVNHDGTALAVIVIGFNRFRLVIEAMGQERADMILTELGKVLTDCLSELEPAQSETQRLRTAAVASIDHFRFAIMVTTSGEQSDLAHLQQLLLDRLARPIQIAGQTVSLSSCQGVAIYPSDAGDVDSLMQRADNAMRDAQSRGGGFKYYCAETDAAAARKLKVEHMLHEAVDRNDLSLAYQPLTEVRTGRVAAAEALLRWQQPDRSFISPAEFVPIAEECGLMIRIGEFVLEQACQQLKKWHSAGIDLPYICVNVAKAQFASGDFVATIKRVLAKYDVDPCTLELELSERGVLSGSFDVIEQLNELKQLGIRLSIDDFGTGDSAIAYLRDLPIDVLKIDRSYVAGLDENEKDAALVSAMVALGQRLNLKVVAEGVETREQLIALRELDCDVFQGFLVSQPLPADDFAALFGNYDSADT